MPAADVKPFKIDVPDSSIKLLKDKLAQSIFPEEVDFSNDWNSGAPLHDVKRLAEYWRDGFDWRAQEAKLNALPQFTTDVEVDGFGSLNIHLLHQRSSKPGSIPLLFCHGWPGSFLEVIKILPLLTEPESGISFHVVAPSLPNYGFSDGVSKKGFSIPQYAEAMHKVMLNLGYDRYGGDWGFFITRLMGIQYPKHCLATHINMILVIRPPSPLKAPLCYLQHACQPYTKLEKEGRLRSAWMQNEGSGYNQLQGTKPSTIAFAMVDSPVALLAWIYEKLHDWTDSYPWTDDEILTWISIYQFSKAGPAANQRIYYETKHVNYAQTSRAWHYVPNVPLGCSIFPRDLIVPPLSWAQTLGPIAFQAFHDSGGHFAAYEKPEKLAEDLRKMFGKNGGASKIAKTFEGVERNGARR